MTNQELPPQSSTPPPPPPPPAGAQLNIRYQNRIQRHGVEAIRWSNYEQQMDTIRRFVRGRRQFIVGDEIDFNGSLLLRLPMERDQEATVSVPLRHWIAFVAGKLQILDDEAMEQLLEERARELFRGEQEDRMRSAAKLRIFMEEAAAERWDTALCNAVSPASLIEGPGEPPIVTCTLPAGHGGRWHQSTVGKRSLAWLQPPSAQDLLLDQAARIMNEIMECGELDDSAYGSEVHAWLKMFEASVLDALVGPLDPFHTGIPDAIGSPTEDETQRETEPCDEGTS